ncbi:Rv2175c family DNA-binding protein [Micromonospora sp. C28SCA-DRY-2]|uniref:Rv2175c family DNA-binding protein n=1 Tax=Micromonospora sp. C28SCA-DRY-2 TaxID=3059522 RepID=UPI0026754BB9|nr:Rv2175c family DNA-binding protein [Micromonospora sp. C28SCA-DRY-2]MDO3704597.1 Rv2175c family DNA-binding protein [Micromonospora sp. C28SCA-DRY-2]
MTDSVPADRGAPAPDLAGPADPADWLTLPDVAERLDVSISKVHQMVRDRELIAVRRDGVRRIPVDLVANRTVLKHLPGVLTLLADAGYDDEAALRWLYEPDESLPGATPADAMLRDALLENIHRANLASSTPPPPRVAPVIMVSGGEMSVTDR